MIVGSFGILTFRTSSFDVRTFKNLARKRSYSFSEHEVVSGKPYLQRGHENLETITFDMVLDRGLNPLPVDCRKSRDLYSTGCASHAVRAKRKPRFSQARASVQQDAVPSVILRLKCYKQAMPTRLSLVPVIWSIFSVFFCITA